MRTPLLAALLGILLIPSLLQAQIETRGKSSFQVAGFGSIREDVATGTALAGVSHFATDAIEIGADLTMTMTSVAGEGKESEISTDGFVTARLRYNFVGQSLFVPYLSVGSGTALDSENSIYTFDAGAGFKRFLNERVSFNGEVNYRTLMASTEFGSSSTSSLDFLLGISIYTGD